MMLIEYLNLPRTHWIHQPASESGLLQLEMVQYVTAKEKVSGEEHKRSLMLIGTVLG